MVCKTCSGTGEIITYENQSPLGSGMVWNEEIVDDCPDCTELGICPKCGKKWDGNIFDFYLDCIANYRINNFTCSFCDWQPGEGPIESEAK